MNYYKKGEKVAIRQAFGEALFVVAGKNDKIVALSADLAGSLTLNKFWEKYPERFFNTGVAEQNMIGVSAGLAIEGFIPFAGTFGCFLGRTIDHVRQSINHNGLNVKIVGSHGGVSNAQDGPSAHAIEDIAFFRSMPNMAIVVPADPNQTLKAVEPVTNYKTSVYLRLYREPLSVFTDESVEFTIGKAQVLKEGKDLTVISCGPHVGICLEIAEELQDKISIEVINNHTIAPIDHETIVTSVKKTGKAVTVEDHYVVGGLGSAVSEVLAEYYPAPLKRIGLTSYATTGLYQDVLKKMGIDKEGIKKTITSL